MSCLFRRLSLFGMATLLSDLSDRGLLDSTIVWWSGEFGRGPKVQWNPPWNGGRSHYGQCFCAVLAGGGFKGGRVVGASNKYGTQVLSLEWFYRKTKVMETRPVPESIDEESGVVGEWKRVSRENQSRVQKVQRAGQPREVRIVVQRPIVEGMRVP